VEGDVEEAIRAAFLKLDEDMTHGLYQWAAGLMVI